MSIFNKKLAFSGLKSHDFEKNPMLSEGRIFELLMSQVNNTVRHVFKRDIEKAAANIMGFKHGKLGGEDLEKHLVEVGKRIGREILGGSLKDFYDNGKKIIEESSHNPEFRDFVINAFEYMYGAVMKPGERDVFFNSLHGLKSGFPMHRKGSELFNDFFKSFFVVFNVYLISWSSGRAGRKRVEVVRIVFKSLRQTLKNLHYKDYEKTIARINSFVKKNDDELFQDYECFYGGLKRLYELILGRKIGLVEMELYAPGFED